MPLSNSSPGVDRAARHRALVRWALSSPKPDRVRFPSATDRLTVESTGEIAASRVRARPTERVGEPSPTWHAGNQATAPLRTPPTGNAVGSARAFTSHAERSPRATPLLARGTQERRVRGAVPPRAAPEARSRRASAREFRFERVARARRLRGAGDIRRSFFPAFDASGAHGSDPRREPDADLARPASAQTPKMADEGEISALVCDNGSGMVKVRARSSPPRERCQGGSFLPPAGQQRFSPSTRASAPRRLAAKPPRTRTTTRRDPRGDARENPPPAPPPPRRPSSTPPPKTRGDEDHPPSASGSRPEPVWALLPPVKRKLAADIFFPPRRARPPTPLLNTPLPPAPHPPSLTPRLVSPATTPPARCSPPWSAAPGTRA